MVSELSSVLRLMLRMWPDLMKAECSMFLSLFKRSSVSLFTPGSIGLGQL